MHNDITKPLVSVIMPVYNSEQFVGMAVQSVLEQTYKNFELIIIDDGSSDNSGAVCDEYAAKDSRIKVIHKVNGGVCSGRNLGINICQGEYISFIDNDDVYEPNFLAKLVDVAVQTNADLVKCGRNNIKINAEQVILSQKQCYYETSNLSFEEFTNSYYEIKKSDILSSVWNGIYKKDTIINENIKFDESLKHGNEDIIFNCFFFEKCTRVAIVSDILYTHYYRISHSTSMHFYEDQIESRIRAINMQFKLASFSKNQDDKELIILEGIRECFRILLQADSTRIRKQHIEYMSEMLDFNILYKSNILKLKRLSKSAKIDLFLIKHKLYFIYFQARSIRNIFK